MDKPLVLAGCGKMGGALLEGWLQRGVKAENVYVVEINSEIRQHLSTTLGVHCVEKPMDLPHDLVPGVVMLAVKPQMMDDVCPQYAPFINAETVFLSIAAGKTVAYFENHLSVHASIVRAMPNTPAAVRRGITVAFCNNHVSEEQRQFCHDLLEAVGSVEWVDEEDKLDAVTALSGGGPAYVFLLVEALAQAGIDAGLPADLSLKLARQTVAGSGELLHQASEDASTLRQNVTSPGGTTAEALRVLMAEDGWQPLISKAIAAAANRSRELAK